MKILFYTFGCRLNQAETDSYQEELSKRGFVIVDKKPFDIAVINSCSVTHKADREARQAIRKLKRLQPKAKIILTGCANIKLPEIDYYIKDKENFSEKFYKCVTPPSPFEEWRRGAGGMRGVRQRANIKIQTGCDNHCTYCYTRIARGKSRSINPQIIIQQIKNKEKQNIKEVVLTGVNIGQYSSSPSNPLSLPTGQAGTDVEKGNYSLTELIKKIFQETKIPRIRLSSINPEFVYKNKKFQNLFKNKRLCQHLHLSLQSGSDAVLKRMNRHYTASQYLKIVKDYQKKFPLFGFTTDVIVGFPGETEKEFKQTCDFVKKCGFLKIHIFRYSKRDKTPASLMPKQVGEDIKRRRSNELNEINAELQKKFKKRMKGKKLSVLFEKEQKGRYLGHAQNYLLVSYKSKKNLENQVKTIIIR